MRRRCADPGKLWPLGRRAIHPLDPDASRVLFDCHIPKGVHYHLGEDPDGQLFEWKSLQEAEDLFLKKVQEKFGEIPSFKELMR